MHKIFCCSSKLILINKEKKEKEMDRVNFNSNSTEIIPRTLVFMRSLTLSSISVTNFNSRKFRNNSKS